MLNGAPRHQAFDLDIHALPVADNIVQERAELEAEQAVLIHFFPTAKKTRLEAGHFLPRIRAGDRRRS